jgi:hypothetical protein
MNDKELQMAPRTLLRLIALLAMAHAVPLDAQAGGVPGPESPSTPTNTATTSPRLWLAPDAGPVQESTRPPISAEFMAYQAAAGMIGGLGGSLLMILPFARGEVRSRDDSSRAPAVAALLGYFAGSATGVQLYSRYHGVRGSWGWTFGGAAIGAIGGPAFLITIPIGATIGFNQTRQAPADARPVP